MKQLHNDLHLKSVRKFLRNHATSAEAFLWNYLKKSQLDGKKFRRQHSIGKFIVDFFCYEEMLAIELDGEFHNQSVERDYIRTKYLKECGINVIRFENRFVFEHTEQVLKEIREQFKS